MKATTALKWQVRIAAFMLASVTVFFIAAIGEGRILPMLTQGAMVVFWEWVLRNAWSNKKKLEQMLLEAGAPHA